MHHEELAIVKNVDSGVARGGRGPTDDVWAARSDWFDGTIERPLSATSRYGRSCANQSAANDR